MQIILISFAHFTFFASIALRDDNKSSCDFFIIKNNQFIRCNFSVTKCKAIWTFHNDSHFIAWMNEIYELKNFHACLKKEENELCVRKVVWQSHKYVRIYQNNLATDRINHDGKAAYSQSERWTINMPKIEDKLAYK